MADWLVILFRAVLSVFVVSWVEICLPRHESYRWAPSLVFLSTVYRLLPVYASFWRQLDPLMLT
ncbi:unnamed protein product, partial [Protopolystoma xenopodis]